MSVLVALLRMMLVVAFAAGFGVPHSAAAAPMPMAAQAHAQHSAMMSAMPVQLPQDEACREHCLGVSILVAPVLLVPQAERVRPVHVAAVAETAPSLSPQPEGHPPRA